MDDARLDEIRALAERGVKATGPNGGYPDALRDLLKAHDGLRSRVLELATELEREWDPDLGPAIAECVRKCL